MKIEHYRARSSKNQFEYSNLLAVCKGVGKQTNTTSSIKIKYDEERFTCDNHKHDKKLEINPQSIADMQTIYYDQQGHIKSDKEVFQKDLDEILNLNDEFGYLISNRREALDVIKEKLKNLKPGQDAKSLLLKWKEKCDNKNSHGEYLPYVGIMRWYIDKKLNRF